MYSGFWSCIKFQTALKSSCSLPKLVEYSSEVFQEYSIYRTVLSVNRMF